MRRLVILFLLLLLAVPSGAAFASQEQEIYRIVGAGYYDIWKHSDGTWQASGKPGDKGRTTEHDYALPDDKLKGFKVTRIEVTHNVTEQDHAKAYGRGLLAGVPWLAYERDFLVHSPLVVRADTAAKDLQTGDVTVLWTLDLHPTRPREQHREALDLKENPHVLEKRYQEQVGFAQAVEGWRWYTPVMITWYGVPKAEMDPPDFSVQFHEHLFDDVEPGTKISSKVTYKLNADHPQPETAKLELYHETRAGEFPIPQVHGQIIEFEPGQEITFDYEVTAQTRNSKMVGIIRPVSTSQDRDWSNNRDEARIIVEEPCTDISVTLTYSPRETRIVGDNTELRATVTRAKNGPDSPVNVRFKFGHGSWQEFTLSQGQSKTINDVVHHDRAGSISYSAEAWPVGIEDCNPANNKAALAITVEEAFEPPDEDGDMHTSVTSRR